MANEPSNGVLQMLVLSRKPGEKIFIGNDITLTIVKIDGNKVRLGLEAPQEVLILREEIAKKNQDQAAEAAEPAPEPSPEPATE